MTTIVNTESLKDRDYYLIIDKSGSMSTPDTKNGKSRWDYARESTEAIARELQKYDPDGITVIPFNGTFKEYPNTTPEKVADIWNEQSPMGGTVLAPVLDHCFNDYLKNKKAGTAKPKGGMIVVMTDGTPEDEEKVGRSIVNFGNKLDNADEEFGISFIQVGQDAHATAFLKRLDDDLTSKYGAKNDIVDAKTMDEVESIGVVETLIAALND